MSIILSLTRDLNKFSAIKACLASIEKGIMPFSIVASIILVIFFLFYNSPAYHLISQFF